MTKLLVSVRSVAEARIALAGGVDLIDVKEPRRGSLGAADAGIIAEIVAHVAKLFLSRELAQPATANAANNAVQRTSTPSTRKSIESSKRPRALNA